MICNKCKLHKPGSILPRRASISQNDFSSSLVMMRRYPAIKFIPCKSRNYKGLRSRKTTEHIITVITGYHRTRWKVYLQCFKKQIMKNLVENFGYVKQEPATWRSKFVNYFALQIWYQVLEMLTVKAKDFLCVRTLTHPETRGVRCNSSTIR